MKPFSLFGIVPPGLEKLAASELNQLGFPHGKIEHGGIAFAAHQTGLFRLNSYSRIFSRFIIRFAQFHADSFWELEKRCRILPWENFIQNQKLKFRVHCKKSKLMHSKAIAERMIKAIASRLQIPHLAAAEGEDDAQLIIVNVAHDFFQVSIDSSGAHLHKRGYRQKLGQAPIRENLAAALIFQIINISTV